jgi:hypothetical protein
MVVTQYQLVVLCQQVQALRTFEQVYSRLTITFSRSVDFPFTFSGVGGTFNLGDNLTTGTTRTTTLTSGTLALNGFNYSTGLFSSAGALARTISFGTKINGSGSALFGIQVL